MLFLLHLLEDDFSLLRVFRYITVRAVAGAGTAFLLTMFFGPMIIRGLQRLNVGAYIRKDGSPPLHEKKAGTPTMGGLVIIGAILVSTLLWADPFNFQVWVVLGTLVFMGSVGFVDDFDKVARKHAKGIRARTKFVLQCAWAIFIVLVLMNHEASRDLTRKLMVPFLKEPLIADMGFLGTMVFVGLVIVGSTNAVNLTDGLDGLAIGCSMSVAISYLVMAYVAGHSAFAAYLLIPYIPGSGELAVLCGCITGACLGFLWYNCHPAQIFMGDTGSLALGGAMAMVAILIKQELVLIIVGGVFVIEALSVILQVASFKLNGKRIFAMAPLHHHFELRNWSETQVTVRFWIMSIIFSLLGLLTLKIR